MRKGTKAPRNKYSYKGVTWVAAAQKFKAGVTKDGILYSCGFHDTPRDAAVARDRKIIALNLGIPLQIFKKLEKETV